MTFDDALKALALVMQRPEMKGMEPAIRYRPKFAAWEVELRSIEATYRFHKLDQFVKHVHAFGITAAQVNNVKLAEGMIHATHKQLN